MAAIIEEDIECVNKDLPSAIVSSRSRARESNVPHSGAMEILNQDDEWQRCWTVLRGQRILCYPDRTVRDTSFCSLAEESQTDKLV